MFYDLASLAKPLVTAPLAHRLLHTHYTARGRYIE